MNLGKLFHFPATDTFNLMFNPLPWNTPDNKISIWTVSTMMLLFSHQCFSSLVETQLYDTLYYSSVQ